MHHDQAASGIGSNLMAITVKNTELKKAIEGHEFPKRKIAALADISTVTLNKALDGDTDLNLDSVRKIAKFTGLEVELVWKKRKPEAVLGA